MARANLPEQSPPLPLDIYEAVNPLYIFARQISDDLAFLDNGIYRKTDLLIANDATLDTVLAINLAAAQSYRIRAQLYVTTANAAMGYKFASAYSGAGATIPWTAFSYSEPGAVPGPYVMKHDIRTGHVPATAVAAATFGPALITVEQIIKTVTGGVWALKLAQNVPDAGSLILIAGSSIVASKL